jgi:Fe-S-cluster containining protein
MSTLREILWLTCKQKRCCYSSLVLVTGRDVARIAGALHTQPATFLIYFSSPQPTHDSFYLAPEGVPYRLALAKGASARKNTSPPCIFLVRTRDKHHRCGLGDLRPMTCQTFPLETAGGQVYVTEETGCTCRAWNLADSELADERPMLARRVDEYAEYCAMLQGWNGMVAQLDEGVSLQFEHFCAYLMRWYEMQDEEIMRAEVVL